MIFILSKKDFNFLKDKIPYAYKLVTTKEEKDKGFSPKKNPKKLMKEMDQIVQDDIKNIH